jgi:type II secretion system protein H
MRATSATGSGPRLCARRNRTRGFTLIEIMIALAIMVLLAASLPLLIQRATPTRRVVAASERLITELQLLRAQASASGRPIRIAMSSSGYRVVSGAGEKTVRLPSSMELRSHGSGQERAIDEIALYPDGTTSGARIELIDSGRRAVVEVSVLTGRVRRST